MTNETKDTKASTRSALLRGLRLRCPHCGVGRTFDGWFKPNRTCTACGVQFERQDGESVGGMYINLGVAELIAIPGFFLVHAAFAPPVIPHIIAWVIFNVLFCLGFYRNSRSLWMAISYVTGGVYRGSDEWTA